MNSFSFSAIFLLIGMSLPVAAQTCTGLCLQQLKCAAGTTTSITGTVYAPNGLDPLPDVLVYIPNAPVDVFQPGVQCPVVGQPPSGSPLVGATTAVDGSFTLTNVPVGTDIPLVIQTGRWRRQVVVPTTTACANTAFSTRMPRNQSEGDIPKIAIATGSVDQVECVLRKVGLDDSEFTDIKGTGRINLFSGSHSPGAKSGSSTSSEDDLMGNAATLKSYDVLMLPCEGRQYQQPNDQLANVIDFANSGGRIYSSHYSYVWMFQNGPFAGVANWDVGQHQLPDGIATVDTSFYEGSTLAQWLQLVGATTTIGQMPISTLRHDLNGVNAPTQSWLRLNDKANNDPVMQFVFDAPIGATANQCGRVLYNEYHVENTGARPGASFPTECSLQTMTPQEKLLEYSLFELTADGNAATLTPKLVDFGSQALGFATAPQTFTWTNNSTFGASVTLLKTTGDFSVTGSNCTAVPAGASCQIAVTYTPTVLGPGTGTLTVGSSGSTLVSKLTGIGTPDLAVSTSSLAFGNADVGFPVSQQFVLTNTATGLVPLALPVTTGDFTVQSTCGTGLPQGASCGLTVSFQPTATGPRAGNLTLSPSGAAYVGVVIALTGNGVDFTMTETPNSGSVIAGHGTTSDVLETPIAGFNASISLSCTTDAPGATCDAAVGSFVLGSPQTTRITMGTTSRYKVVGYGGFGGGLLWFVALGSGSVLWCKRRKAGALPRAGLTVVLLATISLGSTGCSGKLPAENAGYTPAGNYTFTVKATDGLLVHTATYAMKVTVN